MLQKIYDHSPVIVQHMMASLSGFLLNRSRYGKPYWEHRRWLEEFDQRPLGQKVEYQNDELVKFIKKSASVSRFYQELYTSNDLNSLHTANDLRQLPIVDKELLRTNMQSVYTVQRKGSVEGHTGGTTGKSLVVRFTPEDMMKRMALLDNFKKRLGFEHRKMKRATFNGKHIVPHSSRSNIFWRYNLACRQMMYSTFHLTDQNLGRYVASLNKFKPQAIDGFFTSMVDVANYIERNQIQLTFSPIGLFPTSETVTEPGRATLERVFGSRVYDQYASSEGAPFVNECIAGSLHVEMSSGVFERTDNDEILVTSFSTNGTPLIRYAIGDSMIFADYTDCACGVESQIISSIAGRNDDFIYGDNGAKINGGNVANLFKNMPNALIRAQVIQEQFDQIRILLEVDRQIYESRYDDLLRDEFEHKVGNKTTLVIEHVTSIARETSGKYRLIKNSLKSEEGPIDL